MSSTCAGPGSGNAPTCAGENPQFRDAWAQPCAFWAGADCFQALSYGYTQEEADELRRVCAPYGGDGRQHGLEAELTCNSQHPNKNPFSSRCFGESPGRDF